MNFGPVQKYCPHMNNYLKSVFGQSILIKQFIFLKNLDFFVMKYFVWIEKLKSISNASNFFEGFQLAKLVEIQIPSK